MRFFPKISFLTVLSMLSLAFSTVAFSQEKHKKTQASKGFPWQSTLNRDHPLNGKIWSVREKRYISPENLIQRIKDIPYIGLGETHDNPDHHILQAWLIEQIIANSQRKPDIVMEMIAQDQEQDLKDYLSRTSLTPSGLKEALNWQKSGWPEWSLYAPIAQISLSAHLTIRAGNPSKKLSKTVGRQGYDALGVSLKKELQLDKSLPPLLAKDLQAQIITGHCNMIPPSATTPMVRIQRLRDAVMAQNLLKSPSSQGAILIAGSGHVRIDRGVPWYIRHLGQKMTSVMMVESHGDNVTDPLTLTSPAPKGHFIADYLWVTPRTAREDQCEKFKKFMKRKHKPVAPQ